MDMSLQEKLEQKKKLLLRDLIKKEGSLTHLNDSLNEKRKLKETYSATYDAYDKILQETQTLIAVCSDNINLWKSHQNVVNEEHRCPLCKHEIADTSISDQILQNLHKAEKEKHTLESSKSVTQVYLKDIMNKTNKLDHEIQQINSVREQMFVLQDEISSLSQS